MEFLNTDPVADDLAGSTGHITTSLSIYVSFPVSSSRHHAHSGSPLDTLQYLCRQHCRGRRQPFPLIQDYDFYLDQLPYHGFDEFTDGSASVIAEPELAANNGNVLGSHRPVPGLHLHFLL